MDLLLILGGNPVFMAPPEWNLRGAIQMAKLRVRLGEHLDETSEVCQWNIPQAHAYEHWSDAPAYDGTVSIIQPLIAPLYGGKSAHEMLAAFTENPEKSSFETVRDYWRATYTGADYETWWKHSVHDGFVKDSALPAVSATAKLIPARCGIDRSELPVTKFHSTAIRTFSTGAMRTMPGCRNCRGRFRA